MKQIALKLSLSFFSLIICLLLVEGGSRIFLDQVLQKSTQRKFQFEYYRLYSHVPGFQEGDGNTPRLSINQQGFRRTEAVNKQKPKGLFRVFLLGGSAAHGISSGGRSYPIRHLNQDETIDAYLEQMLKAAHPDQSLEVINAAVTGYQVFQHTSYLLAELLDYDPDMVIFFDGFNDHWSTNSGYDYYQDNPYMFWKDRLQSPSLFAMTDYLALWASDFSAFARGYFAWRLQLDASKRTKNHPPWRELESVDKVREFYEETAPSRYLRSVEVNLLLLNHFGIDTIIGLQPVLMLRNEELMPAAEMELLAISGKEEAKKILYPLISANLKALTGRHDVPYIDFVSTFNEISTTDQQLFIDYCHLTSQGSQLVAKVIYPHVEKVYLQRFKTKP